MKKIRLFIDEHNFYCGLKIKVSGNNFDYLVKVMRQKIGDKIFIFNGREGEFLAEISKIEKKFLQNFRKIFFRFLTLG